MEAYLQEYNRIIRRNQRMYYLAARSTGLSEAAFHILYTLRDEGASVTQGQLVQQLFLPKQTVNSALKRLRQEGLLLLEPGADRRTKNVSLTAAGLETARQTADQVRQAELDALNAMGTERAERFLADYRMLTELVRQRVPGQEQEG